MKTLIQDVDNIFDGDIVYSSNWDSYTKIKFWQDLKYIGISGYFPLSDLKNPNIDVLDKAWKAHLDQLESFSNTLNKPVLFTEYGFRSIDYATKEPWIPGLADQAQNDVAQAIAYEAFFKNFHNKPWFSGGFIWKWTCTLKSNHHIDYSPENKPAEKIIGKYFRKD